MPELPKWYRPVVIVALLWNLVGASAYLMDVTMTPEKIAALPEAQRAMYAARPMWFVAAYAIAVWFGTAGSLGLVLRKRWATPVLVVSLIGLVVQDAGLLSRPEARANPPVLVLQALVLVIAILLVRLGRSAQAKGWLG